MKLKFLFPDYVVVDEEQEDDFRAWQPCKFVKLPDRPGSDRRHRDDGHYSRHFATLARLGLEELASKAGKRKRGRGRRSNERWLALKVNQFPIFVI